MLQNQDFIQEFIEEAKVHIEKIEANLLKREGTRNNKDAINEIFRSVHSIKGTAGFFGLKKIVSLAHAMENIFGEIRTGNVQLTSRIEDVMLSANDCLKDMIDDVLASEFVEVAHLIDELNAELLNDEKKTSNDGVVELINNSNCKISISGSNYKIIKEGMSHGHKLYEIKLRINKDLLNYNEGPVKLFNKIQSVGMVIDTITDHSEINSFEDILTAVENGNKDVYMGILVTTVLEKELFSSAIEISTENIMEMSVNMPETLDTIQNENVGDNKQEIVLEYKSEPEQLPVVQSVEEVLAASKNLKVEDSIRVHVSVLNDLLNMASEMVLGRNQLLRTLENHRKNIQGLSPILQNIDRLTSGMQEKIMQTRMQPMSNVFNKFPRIIRDLAKHLGKEMELQLEGEEVELDKSVIEALTDPLTHLVRNAADHGLEMPDERAKNGKHRAGNIKLRAFHEGGYVNIDVIDDGHGMDASKIAQKALENGLIGREDINRMSEMEMLKLIFKPGFSTATKVSDISGRGVGMDVVRTNIEKLGGAVEIFTIKGQGTTIRLILPLTLAIIQSLIVEVSGQKFALPQANLKEIVRIKQGDKARRIEYIHDSQVLRLRGRLLPIIHLGDVLGLEHKKDNEVTRILVLQMGIRSFGVAVDSILANEETLVKPLPVYLKSCECYSGVTIMGDGKTAMILDIEGLIRLSELKFIENDKAQTTQAFETEKLVELQNLLLFKCTGNETFAIDLSMIARVEEISATDIESIGNKEYIKFRGDSLRVIRPEGYLPVNSGLTDYEKKYVLIPKLVSYPIGIIAEKVIDNVNINLVLNTEDARIHGILGTTIYENKMILLVNIYELFEKADPDHYANKGEILDNSSTVLLVEDTPFFQRQEREYLKGAGYEVILAENGKQALEILENSHVDCVVSDIQMPIMDGIELIKNIRENERFKSLPVIALTSMSGDNQRRLGIESGFDYYELKLDRDSLIEKVKTAIKTKRKEG